MSITLRPAQESDAAFLFRLYAAGRAEEMATWGWDENQQELFLRQQHEARERQYQSYPNTTHRIILQDEEPVGRILTSQGAEICLVDIALLPQAQGSGTGSQLIRILQNRARTEGKAVVLSVETTNPARHLYERLGFTVSENHQVYLNLRWEPKTG